MKQVFAFTLLVALALPATGFGATRIPAKTWRRVKVYDMAGLKKLDPLPRGKIVGVRFNYRHATIRHLKPNWYQGSIWVFRRGAAQADFDYVAVMVSTADLASFRAIPAQVQSQKSYVAYGEVQKDLEMSFTFLRLLGTKVKRDARGNAIVSW